MQQLRPQALRSGECGFESWLFDQGEILELCSQFPHL